jgi:threonine aldolase
LADERSHVIQFELAGMAMLSGVIPRVTRSEDGILGAAQVQAALRPASYYRSDLALAVFENTHNLGGGAVATVAQTRSFLAACAEAGLKTHLDGARLWNAAVALGVSPRELAAGFDTAMVTLSKGLCAPAGSLLLTSAARHEEARRVRKLLGGGMRQAGVLAAAGLVGLETMVDRLAEDHAHARLLGEALAGCRGVDARPVQTNIVVGLLERMPAPEAAAALRARGVLASAMDARTLRLVTHRDVGRADCERAADALRAVLG